MTTTDLTLPPITERGSHYGSAVLVRTMVISVTAFLTLVDLFATQAILPSLARAYDVSPAAMGLAVNASTMGMAVAGFAVALFSAKLDRRRGILLSLAGLAVPTSLLAIAPDLTTFALLRVTQGLFMSAAFTLTLAYLGEHCSAMEAGGAFAAYIAGNVASNLFGRLLSAALADHLGLAANFYIFAGLNIAGAALVYFSLGRAGAAAPVTQARSALLAWAEHLRNPPLRACFGVGFFILFAFIGTFTYVNFVLVRAPFAVGMMTLGFIYFVFAPSLVTTLMAGRAVARFGIRASIIGGLTLALAGLPLLLSASLPLVLAGLTIVGIGTFLAQACATGFVGRAATADRGSASGIYLASYFFGGLVGSAVLGQVFDRLGWSACVAGIALALVAAGLLTARLTLAPAQR